MRIPQNFNPSDQIFFLNLYHQTQNVSIITIFKLVNILQEKNSEPLRRRKKSLDNIKDNKIPSPTPPPIPPPPLNYIAANSQSKLYCFIFYITF